MILHSILLSDVKAYRSLLFRHNGQINSFGPYPGEYLFNALHLLIPLHFELLPHFFVLQALIPEHLQIVLIVLALLLELSDLSLQQLKLLQIDHFLF
jgi:hypothetical protein